MEEDQAAVGREPLGLRDRWLPRRWRPLGRSSEGDQRIKRGKGPQRLRPPDRLPDQARSVVLIKRKESSNKKDSQSFFNFFEEDDG